MQTNGQRAGADVNWGELTKQGLLPQALYLFSCRLAWLRYGDDHANKALLRASQGANAELRSIATRLLKTEGEN
jgi:hypothetical protein